MKGNRFFVLVISSLLSLQMFAPAYGQTDVIGQVKETIKAGSAKELSKYLSQNVDVQIEGSNKQSYSKAQAEFVFRDFFKQHPASECSILHQGSSKGGQLFAILQYKSGTDTYRVFMKIKSNDNQQLLHEISFLRE
jgi:hypothetical protein